MPWSTGPAGMVLLLGLVWVPLLRWVLAVAWDDHQDRAHPHQPQVRARHSSPEQRTWVLSDGPVHHHRKELA